MSKHAPGNQLDVLDMNLIPMLEGKSCDIIGTQLIVEKTLGKSKIYFFYNKGVEKESDKALEDFESYKKRQAIKYKSKSKKKGKIKE